MFRLSNLGSKQNRQLRKEPRPTEHNSTFGSEKSGAKRGDTTKKKTQRAESGKLTWPLTRIGGAFFVIFFYFFEACVFFLERELVRSVGGIVGRVQR